MILAFSLISILVVGFVSVLLVTNRCCFLLSMYLTYISVWFCGSYLHDVIYITSFVQLSSIISGKFWYTYLVVRSKEDHIPFCHFLILKQQCSNVNHPLKNAYPIWSDFFLMAGYLIYNMPFASNITNFAHGYYYYSLKHCCNKKLEIAREMDLCVVIWLSMVWNLDA